MRKVLLAAAALAISASPLAFGSDIASAAMMSSKTSMMKMHVCKSGYHAVKVKRHGKRVWICHKNHKMMMMSHPSMTSHPSKKPTTKAY